MTQKNSNQISLFSYIQGQRNTFFLGGAHCFFLFENATFLKKLLSKPLKIGGALAPRPHLFRGPWTFYMNS